VPRPTKNACWLAATVALAGCSIRSLATSSLADAMAASGSSYGSDGDPELVRDAVPFALKTMEQIHAEQPQHIGLSTALASGFTQYAYAFVQQDADVMEEKDVARAKEIQARARGLFLRARDYGLDGLDHAHAGFRAALPDEKRRAAALAACTKADVPLLYWTAAPWALAVSDGKSDMRLVGELPIVEALMARALALDEAWDQGSIHEFYVAYDGARSAAEGGGPERAKSHLDRARSLDGNKRLGPLVSYAEAVSVARQDRAEFTRLLEEVVAADVDRHPNERLANLIAQRRARWLLGRAADLFAQ
jgi:predicted anti-sigma-YlaC factor YlaD